MMSRKLRDIIIFLLIMVFLNNTFYVYGEIERENVLLIYNGMTRYGEQGEKVTGFRELLGHFPLKIKEVSQEDYKTGEVFNYDYVIFIGMRDTSVTPEIIEDLRSYNNRIIWIEQGIKEFLQDSKLSLVFQGNNNQIKKVIYKEKSFLLGDIGEFNIVDYNQSKSKIYGHLSDGSNEYPYIINEENLWYVSRLEEYGVLFYILADVLFDIFGYENVEGNQICIFIENVHPLVDIQKLKEIGEYLNEENIPFVIGLIPIYLSPETGEVTTISHMPNFAQTIRYLQDTGGSIVLKEIVEDVDINRWSYESLGKGIIECVKNKIYPIAYDNTSNAMDQGLYIEFKKYFSTSIGYIEPSEGVSDNIFYPYSLKDTRFFNRLIPKNIGHMNKVNGLAVEEVFEEYEKISIVRGHVAGFSFYIDDGIERLKEIINRFNHDVEFLNIKEERNWVKWDEIDIVSEDGEIYCDTEINIEKESNILDRYLYKTTNFMGIVVGIFILILLFIFIYSRKRSKDRLIR